MKPISCDREKEILEAAKAGRLDGNLAAHLTDCPGCRNAVLVSEWLNDFTRNNERQGPLPAPEIIWRRFEFYNRRRRQKKILAPVMLFQKLSQLVIGVAVLLFALAYGPSLWHGLLKWFYSSGLAGRLKSMTPEGLLALKIMLFAALALVVVIALVSLSCWLADRFYRMREKKI